MLVMPGHAAAVFDLDQAAGDAPLRPIKEKTRSLGHTVPISLLNPKERTMSYKVISTVITGDKPLTPATETAITLATRFQAHFEAHTLGLDMTDPGFYYAGAEAMVLDTNLKQAWQDRTAAETAIERRMTGEVTPWSRKGAVLQQTGIARYAAQNLRFSDLVVLPRPYEGPDGSDDSVLAEACLFTAERPVLMIPQGATAPLSGGRILLGWNDGAEALSAARAALPMLQQADLVDICVIDPPRTGDHRSDPGGLLAQYLVRHGVKSQVAVLTRSEASIGHILMRHARETGAEMIVTGAYGHSRLRQAVFGGTSRDLLGACDIPLFMAR